ncbi:MAG: macro domain-containing protein [bacterium]|nr:macro domain-containing protein [bacterium]
MNIRDRITIAMGNIVEQDTEAIVNAANTDLIMGSGVAGAIRAADDGTIQRECKRIGSIGLGDAAITSGGATGIPYVIHAAGMHLGGLATVDTVRRAVRKSLMKAKGKGIKTISFPAIGAGIGGLSMENCAEISLEEARNHLAGETSLREIRFVLFDEEGYRIFEEYFEKVLPSGE